MPEDDEDMKSLKTLAQDLDTFIMGGLYVMKINIYIHQPCTAHTALKAEIVCYKNVVLTKLNFGFCCDNTPIFLPAPHFILEVLPVFTLETRDMF